MRNLTAPTTFAKGKSFGVEISGQLAEIPKLGLSGYFSYTAEACLSDRTVSGGFTIEDVAPGETGPAAFDQIHTAVAGITERERWTGIFVTAQMEYGSGMPASLPNEDGVESLVRLPGHFGASLYFGSI